MNVKRFIRIGPLWRMTASAMGYAVGSDLASNALKSTRNLPPEQRINIIRAFRETQKKEFQEFLGRYFRDLASHTCETLQIHRFTFELTQIEQVFPRAYIAFAEPSPSKLDWEPRLVGAAFTTSDIEPEIAWTQLFKFSDSGWLEDCGNVP
jgi:hypothetical protein